MVVNMRSILLTTLLILGLTKAHAEGVAKQV